MAEETISTRIVADADFSNLIADVHKVTASLSKLQEQLANSNKMLANNIAVINRSFSDTLRSTGQFSTHFVSLTSDVEKFGKNLDGGKLKLKEYFGTFQSHVKTSGGLIRELARQQVAMQNAILQPLGRNSQGLMQFNVHVPRGLDEIKNKTAIARQELQIMNRVIQDGAMQLINWGKNTQWAGRQLTVGLTVPMAAFGKAAADAFRLADQELTRLTKVYGDIAGTSAAELGKVRQEVINTSKELSAAYGTNFRETISLAADIAATGKQGQELLDSVKETSRLAVLGEVDRQEAMKATLAIQSAFKQNTDELSQSINFLNAVENQTSTTLNDLVEAIPKAGPVIKGLGGSVQDLALYLTAMREGGVSASEGANALKSALASLINPTDVAVSKFQGFGIDLLSIVNNNAGNVTATLFELQAALDKLDPLQKQQAIEQLFGKFQFSRLNALFENLGRQGSQTLQVLDLMKASTSDLATVANRELAAVTESASGRYKRAIESLRADLAGLGDSFLSISTTLINIVDKALEFFNALPKPVKQALTFLGALTAVAGPLIMLTGVLANFFGYMLKGAMHMKAFFKGGEGWKYLTPEMMAAEKAGRLVEQSFYSDAKAAAILQTALRNLIDEFSVLEAKAKTGAYSVGPAVSTMAGNLIMGAGGGRVVDPNHPLVGAMGTRASTHMVPRGGMTEEQRMAQTIFGLVPGSIPVNRKIGEAPQIYMNEPLPNVPGLTTAGGVSTGVVSGEAARWHSMMATLAMQSKSEVEQLKKQIATTGVVSKDFMSQFDDMLPIISKITDNAAKESAIIVAELRAGKITVESAKAKIIALNLEVEQMIASAAGAQATAMGRTLNPTIVPTLNQPVVDPTGKSNMRELFKKSKTRDFIDKVARSLGVRTSGAGYNIETTKPRKFNTGGPVYLSGGSQSPIVPGPNVNKDVVPAMLTPGEFVVNREATSRDPEGLAAYNAGQAVIVPIQGANAGGMINSVRKVAMLNGGGPASDVTLWQDLSKVNERMFNSPNWESEVRTRHIMHDAAILADRGLPIDQAIRLASKDYDTAFKAAINPRTGMIDKKAWIKARREVFQRRAKHLYKLRNAQMRAGVQNPVRLLTTTMKSRPAGIRITPALAKAIQNNAAGFGGDAVVSKIFGSLFPKGLDAQDFGTGVVSEHTSPFGRWGYKAVGNYGQAMLGEEDINARTNRLSGRTSGIFPDEVIMTNRGLQSYERQFLGRTSVSPRRMPSVRSAARLPSFFRRALAGMGDRRVRFATAFAANSGGMIPGYNMGGKIPGVSYYNRGTGIRGAAREGWYSSKGNAYMAAGAAGEEGIAGSARGMGGAGMMTGLGLQMAGSVMGGQAGTAMMIGGTAMQLLPMISGLGRAAKAASSLTGIVRTLGSVGFRIFAGLRTAIAVLTGPIGIASLAITGLIMGIMKWRKEQAEAKRDATSMFGITEKSAKEIGIKYETLTDKVKALREEQKLAAEKARIYFESYSQTGVTGLTLTIKQLKELKERIKTDMPETLAILNNIDSSKVNEWAANLKAQMVSSGKSVQEATNLIYALIESSNKAGMGVSALSSKAFSSIQDKGTAASFVMENLAKNIRDVSEIDPSAFASNVDSAISSLDAAVNSLIGTKDATGQTIDEARAIAMQFEGMAASGVKNKQLGEETLKVLKAQRPEFAAILSKSDTIGGMYAKWRLLLQGVAIDLSKISSSQAETLAAFTAGLDAAGDAALKVGGGVDGLNVAAATLKKLDEQYKALSKAANTEGITRKGLSKEAIKGIQDEIKAIRARAEARKKALQETFDRENAELELQQAKLDLQAAIARGDQDAAAAAQIRIQQIQKETSLKAAQNRIDELAAKEEAKQQAVLDKDQAYKDALADAAAGAANQAGRVADTRKTLNDLATKLTDLAGKYAEIQLMPKGQARTDQENLLTTNFSNWLQDMAKAAKTNVDIRNSFAEFLKKDEKGNFVKDKKGNLVPVDAKGTPIYSPTGGFYGTQGGINELAGLASSMSTFAASIMGAKDPKSLSDLYNVLNKILNKGTSGAPTKISADQVTSALQKNQLKDSKYLTDPSSRYTKEGYLEEGVRTALLEDQSLNMQVDKVYTINGYNYRVSKDWKGKKTLVRQALGGYIRRAASGANGITGMNSSQPYLVGERGPELFVPASGGQIIPNNILGARYNLPTSPVGSVGGSANNSYNNNTYTINIELSGTSVTADDIMRRFKAEMALVHAKEGRNRNLGGSF